jgi:MFS transporter, putative metabolite:H+ symporter
MSAQASSRRGASGAGSDDLLTRFDQAPLTKRYWATIVLLVLQEMFEYYDFFIVGYLVAVLAPRWHLTYGQSSIMLLGAGLGAIIGSLLFGKMTDIWGRRPVLIGCTLLVTIGAGGIALIPEDGWIWFALLRILVGIGLGGAVSAETAMIVEITPTRYRTFMSSAMVAPVSLGIVMAAVLASVLLPVIGWRGVAAVGCFPIVLCVLIYLVVPESTRWLISRDRLEDARKAAALQMQVPVDSLPLSVAVAHRPEPAPLAELLNYPRAFWLIVFTWFGMATTTYGYQLWAPTIMALITHQSASAVAGYFIVIGISGTLGRFVFSALPMWFGRRRSGQIMGAGAAILILAAGLFYKGTIAGYPAFFIYLTAAAIFVNGGFANMSPFAAESYPVRLAGRAVGLAQGINGVGKMVGPLALGLIAGAGDLVTPRATEAAVIPAFSFLAACALIAALAYTFLPIETHGKALSIKGETEPAS